MHSSSRNNQWVHSNNASGALTLQEIANALYLTRERVRQIRDKALSTLRYHANAMRLKTFL